MIYVLLFARYYNSTFVQYIERNTSSSYMYNSLPGIITVHLYNILNISLKSLFKFYGTTNYTYNKNVKSNTYIFILLILSQTPEIQRFKRNLVNWRYIFYSSFVYGCDKCFIKKNNDQLSFILKH